MQVNVDECRLKTKVINNAGRDAVWNETLSGHIDCKRDELFHLKVKHKGIISDETIGIFTMNVYKLLKMAGKKMKSVGRSRSVYCVE